MNTEEHYLGIIGDCNAKSRSQGLSRGNGRRYL